MFGGGVSPYALDPTNAEKRWKMATELMNSAAQLVCPQFPPYGENFCQVRR